MSSLTISTTPAEGRKTGVIQSRVIQVASIQFDRNMKCQAWSETGNRRHVDASIERPDELIERPELRYAIGRNGREFVEEHYDIQKLSRRDLPAGFMRTVASLERATILPGEPTVSLGSFRKIEVTWCYLPTC